MNYTLDHTTLRELYDEHFKALVYLCRKYKIYASAEDIVADKFVKLWERKDKIRDAEKAKAFLYVCVMNAIRNFGRDKKRYSVIELDYTNDMAEEIQREEIESGIIARIYEEIEQLPTVCKAVFKKRVFEKKSYAEIGVELNIVFTTVDSHYQRARQLLKKRIPYAMG